MHHIQGTVHLVPGVALSVAEAPGVGRVCYTSRTAPAFTSRNSPSNQHSSPWDACSPLPPLLACSVSSPLDVLQVEAEISFADDIAISSDGRIFFSDASALGAPRLPGRPHGLMQGARAHMLAVSGAGG